MQAQSTTNMYKHIIDSKVFPFLFDEDNKNMKDTKEQNYLQGKIVTALCVLCFDDEIGQVAENIYPNDIFQLETVKAISGLGFPETNSITENGEIQYVFKIRQSKRLFIYIETVIFL